nr:helix-turn-helix domain-containing protein [Rhodococcus gordoniae]
MSDPARPVRAVADELGWSRRHLTNRCTAEFGLSPKEVARVARFDRSRKMLRADPTRRLADIAVVCGFYDQAHLARDWRDLAGVPPSRWLEDEVFPFVQDD